MASYVREQGFAVGLLDAFGEDVFRLSRYRKQFIKIGLDLEEIVERIHPDAKLVGISVHSGMISEFCLELALIVRKRLGKKVVVGGPHASVNYADFLTQGVEFAVVGEGEIPLASLMENLLDDGDGVGIPGVVSSSSLDRIVPNRPHDIESLPLPAWDLIPLRNYWALKMNHSPFKGRFAPLITSRGCPFKCTFCTTPLTSQGRWRGCSPERVIREIKYLKENFDVEDFFIQDDNFTVDPDRVKKICGLLQREELGVRLSLPSGVRMETLSEDLIDALAKARVTYLCLAPESGSRRVRERMQKPLNEKKLYRIQRRCRRRGIKTGAFFIIGSVGEQLCDLFKTAGMIARLILFGTDDISIFIYSPLPGSPMASLFREDFPRDYLGVCWSPRWRQDYARLSWIRKALYAEYCILKLVFRPFSATRHFKNIATKRFETKGEMAVMRLLTLLR